MGVVVVVVVVVVVGEEIDGLSNDWTSTAPFSIIGGGEGDGACDGDGDVVGNGDGS